MSGAWKWAALAPLLLIATAAAAEETPVSTSARAYVTNELSGDLTVIDLATGHTVATVPLGKRPRGIKPSPDGRLLYIALSGSPIGGPGVDESKLPPPDKGADGIGVFDVAQNRLVRILRGVSDPENVAVGPAGDRLYIASEDTGQLVIMDAVSGAIVARVPVGEEPEGVGVSPDGELALITSETDGSVAVVETRTQKVRHKVKVGERPRNVLFAADRAFIPGESDGSVTAIDPIAGKVLWRLVLAGELVRPMGMAAAGPAIFITTGRGGELVRLDPGLGTVTGRVKVGARPWGAAATPDGRYVLTANGPSNDVALVDSGTLQVVARYPAGNRPWGVAILRPLPEGGR